MNSTLREAVELARALRDGLPAEAADRDVVVAPPFTAIAAVAEALKGSPIKVAGQDCHWEASGAFTGEVSAAMLGDAGCWGVILGHSERRRLFGETDDGVKRKLKAALARKLVPIVCVGETLEEREANKTHRVLEMQLRGALEGFAPAELAPLAIAYEPVWAIGTGRTAAPEQAQDAHAHIRALASRLFGEGFGAGLRILYGGSVTPENVHGLMAREDIDGALVGGASLKPISFLRIVNSGIRAVSL